MNREKLIEEIDSLRLKCEALEDLNRSLIALLNPSEVEWRVICREKGRSTWNLSSQMYPGCSRESAIQIYEYEISRGNRARIEIRTCSRWTAASEIASNCKAEQEEGKK